MTEHAGIHIPTLERERIVLSLEGKGGVQWKKCSAEGTLSTFVDNSDTSTRVVRCELDLYNVIVWRTINGEMHSYLQGIQKLISDDCLLLVNFA
ncbi:hypothetical protein CDAR_316341 [Caerostris darwini]|uniref:Uncharacterized protein n=1 Tax=Caerostris darwini TaxID=1538125 RepID=A0AAV4WJJ6_9ARAC|nr:hypothetical protein CDAR_316341 [Caerostris darwini]